MARKTLPPPKTVAQGDGYKCWAAALESWLSVTPGRLRWTQDQLLEKRGHFTDPERKNLYPSAFNGDAINADIFKGMLQDPILDLKMLCKEVSVTERVEGGDIYWLLRDQGYIYIVYTVAKDGDVRHANVIYEVDSEGYVNVMDPMRGALMNKAVDEFHSPVLIAYRQYTMVPGIE